MKNFINTLIKRMIEDRDFMPLRDQEGNFILNDDINILTKDSYGALSAVELIDGDRLSREEIESRLKYNIKTLSEMDSGGIVNFFEVFVFEEEPDRGKLGVITEGQKIIDKKSVKCMSVNLGSRSVDKLFDGHFSDEGLSKIIRELLNKGVYEEINNYDLANLVLKKEKEYEIELKAKTPVITYTLIGINILVAALIFLYSIYSGKSYGDLLGTFGQKDNFRIMAGEYWRLFTPIFLHANVMHLALNCYFLYAVGCTVERIYGRYKYITIYLAAGILGNIASFIFSSSAGVGASGAIFGLLGTLLYFGLEKPALFRVYFGYNVIVTIVINLVYGFSVKGIDNFAHIGGLIGGFLVSGVVSESKNKLWYINRYLYLVLTVFVAGGGLLYGFNNQQNGYFVSNINYMEQLQKDQKWDQLKKLGYEMLAKNPVDGNIRVHLLWSLCISEDVTKQYEDAVKHAKELITIDPINGHFMLGVVYFDMKQYELAKSELHKVKSLNPGDKRADSILSEIEK